MGSIPRLFPTASKAVLLTLIGLQAISADVLIPSSIKAFHQGDSLTGNGAALQIINGSGMSKPDANDPTTWTISSTAWADDWQGFSADNSGNNTWAVLDLGALTANLDQMYLWNVQETNALDRGTSMFNVYYASSPSESVPDTSGAVTPYDFKSGGWTLLSTGNDLAQGTQIGDPGEVFDISGASGARYIGLHLTANHGGFRTGLAEVVFTTGIPNGVAGVTNLAADGITSASAQLRGKVDDIGDAPPSITIRWGNEDGGSDPNGWDHTETLPSTHSGGFSVATSTALDPNTRYFFTAFASNSSGDSIASPSLSFTTLPAVPAVTNVAASRIAADSVTIGGIVTDNGGEDPTMFIYWGTIDGGTDADTWQKSILLGAQSNLANTTLNSLTSGTDYFYRALVTNSGGSTWAASSSSFSTKTPQPPSVINNSANGVTGSSANLRGEIANTGFEAPTVTIYYGTIDGGTISGMWDNSIDLGIQDGKFSFFLTGLDPLSNLFFRVQARNSAGSNWASTTQSFSTTQIVTNSVVINEIHYDHDPKTERGEFVELFNASDSPVDLSSWTLRGAIDYQFPASTTISANGFIVVAEDPATLLSEFAVSGLGPYTGKLSNDGELLKLEDATGDTVDEVTYGIGFPWPSASRGKGPSMELINADLDNDLGSSWRAAMSGFTGPQATYVSAASVWSYRKGTSEASAPIDEWRQPGFTEDPSWLLGTTVIGYGDGDDTTILNDMQNSYSSVFLRKQFNVSGTLPSQLLVRVYYDDGAIVWINGVEVARLEIALGDITFEGIRASDRPGGTPGAAIGSHERAWVDVTVPGAAGILVPGTNTIAVHAFNTGEGSSDFSIDCEVKTPAPSGGSLGTPTPGASNSVFSPNAAPNIRQVNHTPGQPVAGQDVVVTAKVTDPEGVASVTLGYQLVNPGSYINLEDASYETNWTNLPMVDDGSAGDAVPGDSVFSVTMPGTLQTHRRLVRYRITMEDVPGVSEQTPYADDESPNFAYFCYDGVPDWNASKRPGVSPDISYPAAALDSVAVYHLISKESDVIACQWTGSNDGVYRYLGTWVYDGKVYDHMRYRIRGNASTRQVGRNKWKINFANTHPLEARDNYGEKYKIPWDKINVLPGSNPWWRNDASTDGTMFCESLGFRAYQISGGTSCNTHFFHFRVIDDDNEAPAGDQYGGDFWGLYNAIEQPEAEFLNERGLPDGNIYNVHGGSGSSLRNQAATQVSNKSDLFAFQRLHNRGTSQAQWEANLDFEDYFAFNAMNLAINNSDMRNHENVNYYHNSETDKWHILPWDLDLTFEDRPHLGRGDTSQWEQIYHCLQHPEINQAYENQVREILDLFLDNDQAAQLTNEFAGFITQGEKNNLVEASQAMWDYHPRKRKKGIWYANFTSSLLPNRTFADLTQYTKDFLTVGGYGRDKLAAKQTDAAIPNTPAISYAGAAGFPTDALTFNSSSFSDPQGAGTFGSMEWRISQVHNPSTPNYISGDRYIYEAETFYQTDRMTPFSSSFTFPGGSSGVRVGSTYRARVRHIDNTGRASHWSDPIEFAVGEPDVLPWQKNLMITEIMYHPLDASLGEIAAGYSTSDFEFIELKNISDSLTLDLTELRFTKGVDFDFDRGTITSLPPGAYVLVVSNTSAFESRHSGGLPIAGEWQRGDKLDNGGENLKLSFGAGAAIHEFIYDDGQPWPDSPDGDGPGLVLIAPDSAPDHANPLSWRPSLAIAGTPGASDATTFVGDSNADADNDGSNAFLEYFLGSSDAVGNSDGLPTITRGFFDDGTGTVRQYPTFSFQINLAADDVTYKIQRSTSLDTGIWTSAPAVAYVSMTDNGDGTATLVWRSTTPISDLPREFFRLLVQERP
ncbi:MAG: lamin tail domain-containing protein [Akkermansiaceae bacterium]